jgi:hypothetical protein
MEKMSKKERKISIKQSGQTNMQTIIIARGVLDYFTIFKTTLSVHSKNKR